jgi:Sulfotransferase family
MMVKALNASADVVPAVVSADLKIQSGEFPGMASPLRRIEHNLGHIRPLSQDGGANMANDRPIFVMGCPRSGTTMLQLMLHAHPHIAIPPETRFVLNAYRDRWRFGDLADPVNRRALARWIVDRSATRFADLGIAGHEVTERIVAGPPTLGSALGIVFQAYAERFGKPRWGDKRPAYLSNIDVVLRLFPDAQIVTIVRDGRDCVASLKEMPWHRADIYRTIAQWAAAVDNSRRAASILPPDSYCEISYERLVASPERELTRLCAYLGEEYHPAMSEPSRLAPVAVPEQKVWHQRTHEPVTAERVGSWAWRLEPAEVALCEALLGTRLRQLGYSLSLPCRASPGQRLRFERVIARDRLSPVKRAAVGALHRVRRSGPVAARLTSGQRALAADERATLSRPVAGRRG